MPPPPPDEPLAHRVTRLEGRVAELERHRSEWTAERESMFDSIKRYVEKAMAAALEPTIAMVKKLVGDVDKLTASQDVQLTNQEQQLQLLREAAEERGRRHQREEDDDRRRKDAALALEHKKVDVEEAKVDADLLKAHSDARVRKMAAWFALIGAILAALAAALGAILGSHH